MQAKIRIIVGMSALLVASSLVKAGPVVFKEMHSGSVSFVSDLENDKNIDIPKFDNMGGLRTLLGVTVEVCHSGQVDLLADNDDAFQGGTVRGRMIRQYSLFGAGVASFGGQTVNTAFVNLSADDGDGGDNNVFDPTPPDGHDFGTVSYGPLVDGPFFPNLLLYDSNGPGIVSYMVTPVLMVNDLQWQMDAQPDDWQLQVADPLMTVEVKVSYTYIPEPATAGLIGLGGLGMLWARRRNRR